MSSDQEIDSGRESSPENDHSPTRAAAAADSQGADGHRPDESDSESVESDYVAPVLPSYSWLDPRFSDGFVDDKEDAQSQRSGDESDKSDYTPPKLPTFSSLNPPTYSNSSSDEDDEDDEDGDNMRQAAQVADRDLNSESRPVQMLGEMLEPISSDSDGDRPLDKHATLAASSKESSPNLANGLRDQDRSDRSVSTDAEHFDDAIKRSSPTTPLSMLRKATKRKLTRNEKERLADKKRRKVQTQQPALGDEASGDEDTGISGNDTDVDEESVADSTPSRRGRAHPATPAIVPHTDRQPTSDERGDNNGDHRVTAPTGEPVAHSTPASQKRKQQSKPTFAESSQRKPLRTYRAKDAGTKRDARNKADTVESSGNDLETAAGPAIVTSSQTRKRVKLPSSARKKSKPANSPLTVPNGNGEAGLSDAASDSGDPAPKKPKQTPRVKQASRAKQTPKSNPKVKKHDDQPATPSQPQNPLNRVFSKDDLLRISKAVDDFGTQHKLTRVEINDMIQQRFGTGRHSFNEVLDTLWNTIFATCPGKARQKTIDYCRKNFHNYKARGGNWTAEEEEELAMLVAQNGKQWTKWSKNLNRHPEDIRDRYRNYVICGDNLDRSHWTDEEVQLLLSFVDEARGALRGPMRYRPVEQAIDWQKISDQFDRSRSRLQCLTKWKRLQA